MEPRSCAGRERSQRCLWVSGSSQLWSARHRERFLARCLARQVRQDKPLRLAVASFREETQNHVQLIQGAALLPPAVWRPAGLVRVASGPTTYLPGTRPRPVAVDEERGVLAPLPNMTFRHDYPPTKLMFLPDRDPAKPDLLVRPRREDSAPVKRARSGRRPTRHAAEEPQDQHTRRQSLLASTDLMRTGAILTLPHARAQATTGEYLRLWRVHSDGVQLERLLTHVSERGQLWHPRHAAPRRSGLCALSCPPREAQRGHRCRSLGVWAVCAGQEQQVHGAADVV